MRLGPLRRHAVAGQILRHQVQQPGHRRGAGEPEDRDRADVVDGAEHLAEMLVREVRQRAPVGRTALGETASAGISIVVTMLLATSITLMMSAAAVSSFRVLRMRPRGRVSVSPASPLTSGITATPVSKPERPSASFGNSSIATSRASPAGCRAGATQRARQSGTASGCAPQTCSAARDDDGVEHE